MIVGLYRWVFVEIGCSVGRGREKNAVELGCK